MSVFLGTVLILGMVLTSCSQPADTSALQGKEMTVYYSETCTCCKRYINYLESNGINVEAKTSSQMEMEMEKNELGVSRNMASCHTGVIDGYVVEGHVPVEVIAGLLEEQPDQVGVSIPGMPQHAPGMGRPVGERLDILSIEENERSGDIYQSLTY